jgi:hypothetical protein
VIYVLFQLGWIGLLGGNRVYLHLETCKLQKVLLSKLTEFSQGYNVLDVAAFNINGLFGEIHVFLQLTEYACLEEMDPTSTFKLLCIRQYSFQNINQFSQGKKMLDAAASNIDVSLWRDSCVSSTQLIRSRWSKQSLSPPENT